MANVVWEFWRVTRQADGALEWLGATRPSATAAIDRSTMWTLIPRRLRFVANWYVSDDHERADGEATWLYEWIEVVQARQVALLTPDPSAEQIAMLTAPQALPRLGRVDSHELERLLGSRVARAVAART